MSHFFKTHCNKKYNVIIQFNIKCVTDFTSSLMDDKFFFPYYGKTIPFQNNNLFFNVAFNTRQHDILKY